MVLVLLLCLTAPFVIFANGDNDLQVQQAGSTGGHGRVMFNITTDIADGDYYVTLYSRFSGISLYSVQTTFVLSGGDFTPVEAADLTISGGRGSFVLDIGGLDYGLYEVFFGIYSDIEHIVDANRSILVGVADLLVEDDFSDPAPAGSPSTVHMPPSVSDTILFVNTHALNKRSGPGNSHGAIAMLSYGDQVTVLGRNGVWIHVESHRGTGWVFQNFVTQTRPASPPVQAMASFVSYAAVVNVPHALTMRSGPGNSHGAVGWLRDGDTVTVLAHSGLWRQVQSHRGTGWVVNWFLML